MVLARAGGRRRGAGLSLAAALAAGCAIAEAYRAFLCAGRAARGGAVQPRRIQLAARGGDGDAREGVGSLIVPATALKVGQRCTGTVQLVAGFGAFVDIGADQEGLVERARIREEDFAGEVGDLLQVGQQVQVWVSHMRDDGQLGLTMVESKIADSHLIGKAVGLETDLSQFQDIPQSQWLDGEVAEIPAHGWSGCWVDVTLESGATARGELQATRMRDLDQGFVHTVEDVVEVGQTVRVRILGVDVARRRMTLTMCSVDSEEDAGARANFELGAFWGVPKDQWLDGEVSGAFTSGHVVDVTLEGGAFARGLLDDSRLPQVDAGGTVLEIGQKIRVRIHEVVEDRRELHLSMLPDSADFADDGLLADLLAFEGVGRDAWLNGEVMRVDDLGAVVEVEAPDGVILAEGFVDSSHIAEGCELQVGQDVAVRVLRVDVDKRRLDLTMADPGG